VLKKFEEEYQEMQYHKSYFTEINRHVAPNFTFDDKGNIVDMKIPLQTNADEKNILLSYLWKIQTNRHFILQSYVPVEEKIIELRAKIEKYLKQ